MEELQIISDSLFTLIEVAVIYKKSIYEHIKVMMGHRHAKAQYIEMSKTTESAL